MRRCAQNFTNIFLSRNLTKLSHKNSRNINYFILILRKAVKIGVKGFSTFEDITICIKFLFPL